MKVRMLAATAVGLTMLAGSANAQALSPDKAAFRARLYGLTD